MVLKIFSPLWKKRVLLMVHTNTYKAVVLNLPLVCEGLTRQVTVLGHERWQEFTRR
jgi:hypothetical protein